MRAFFSRVALGLAILFVLSTMVHAQKINLDLSTIEPELAAQVLKSQQKPAEKTVPVPAVTAKQAKEWADIGENVGKAIAATARALGSEVNEFVKTPVGKWAFFLVFWYVIGQKIWTIVGGTLIWIGLGAVIWRSFRIFHVPKKEVVKGAGGAETVKYMKYEFGGPDARTYSAIAHAAVFCVLSIIMIFKIL